MVVEVRFVTTTLFTSIFNRAKNGLGGRGSPRPAPAVSVTVVPAPYVPPPANVVPTPVSPQPRKPDVEDVRLAFKFGMQQLTVALHSSAEAPAKIASPVNGR